MLMVDPTSSEEASSAASMIVAFMPEMKEIVQVIQSGDLASEETEEALELCLDGCCNVYLLMRQCLLHR